MKEGISEIENIFLQIKSILSDYLKSLEPFGPKDWEKDTRDKFRTLNLSADIALADGALMDSEGSVILEVAEQLKVSSRAVYKIMVGAAQAVGFKTDVKLNRIAEGLRRSLQVGYKL